MGNTKVAPRQTKIKPAECVRPSSFAVRVFEMNVDLGLIFFHV